MQRFSVQRLVEGYMMEACVMRMPNDIHIVVTGGCSPHIGAISVFENGIKVESIQFEGHKDEFVSKRWAEHLSLLYNEKITVACGIHYDNATKFLIQEVVKQSDELLNEVILNLY